MTADGIGTAAPERPEDNGLSVRTYIEFSKPGITRMVTIASGLGFLIAVFHHGESFTPLLGPLLGCLVGTAVSSAGANGLNEIIERRRDALMRRTMDRPLPSGRLTVRRALVFSALCSVVGPVLLALTASVWAGGAAAATILLYAFVYTPMKPVSSIAVVVGAVPGALPVVIGWLAASPTGRADLLEPPVWSVFALLFVWQMPHFLAIASMYREDYQRGGFRAIPGGMGDRPLSGVILAWSAALVAASFAPAAAMPDRVGGFYIVAATLLGAGMLERSVRGVLKPGPRRARGVFLFSIAYLPLVLGALVLDASPLWTPR